MRHAEYPHHVEIQAPKKEPDGGGGHKKIWKTVTAFNGLLDTPSSREIFAAHQLSNPYDRNLYFPYRTDITADMRCVYKVDGITEIYELIGRPQDQGGQREIMMVPLKLVHGG